MRSTVQQSIDSRRQFLRNATVTLALPVLHSAMPRRTFAAETAAPKRLVAVATPLGIHTPYLFPKSTGRNYEVTPYLEPFQAVRDRVSVISGLMHPDVDGGHFAEKSFLTGAVHPADPSFRNSVSLDLFAAEKIGHLTRFPYLCLGSGMSYTRSGVAVPAVDKPSKVFEDMFLEGTAKQKQTQVRQIHDGQSILDLVGEQTKAIQRQVGYDDDQTLDQYLTSVRELEQRLVFAEQWSNKPKPIVSEKPPVDIADRGNMSGQLGLMYDLMFLALQTDSTRLISLKVQAGQQVVNLNGVEESWHNLSHHGLSKEKLAQLAIIEKEEMRLLAVFLQRLGAIDEQGTSLLDNTAVLFGSNLGNASSHSTDNLPIILAGGGFKLGHHLSFEQYSSPPLANLFVNLLQHLGLEVDFFATSTSTLNGIEVVS